MAAVFISYRSMDHRLASELKAELEKCGHTVWLDSDQVKVGASIVGVINKGLAGPSDNVGGAREAVEHLIRHGHKRIGMLVGDPAVWSDNERLRGYKGALAAHGIPYDDALVKSNCRDVVTAELAAYQLLLELSSPPTAIFAYNNRSAIGAVRAINKLRPTTALVGFDDFESAEMLSLTVQAQDTFQLGKLATETLLRRLKGKEFDIQNVRIPTWLIERGSGEKAPQVVTDNPSQGGSSGP